MANSSRKRSKKAGLPPGTLMHIGKVRRESALITVIDYDSEHCNVKQTDSVDEALTKKNKSHIRWVNVDGIHQVDVLEKIGDKFNLHPLVLEDILNTNQRPKVEEYDGYLYIVARMIEYQEAQNSISTEQVSIVLGKDFVLTFQEDDENTFKPLRERIEKGISHIRKMGADYLVYALLDSIVDSYFVLLENYGEKIEYNEDIMILKPTPKILQSIHHMKREMLHIHKAIWPLREVVGAMERRETPFVTEATAVYLRDVYDHIIQLMDSVETYRDMLSSMLDIYLSSTSNKMNEVMKLLTVFSTIFMPLTFIVGIYGMNFKYMPELDWPLGYPSVWFMMIMVAIFMLITFKKKKWL